VVDQSGLLALPLALPAAPNHGALPPHRGGRRRRELPPQPRLDAGLAGEPEQGSGVLQWPTHQIWGGIGHRIHSRPVLDSPVERVLESQFG